MWDPAQVASPMFPILTPATAKLAVNGENDAVAGQVARRVFAGNLAIRVVATRMCTDVGRLCRVRRGEAWRGQGRLVASVVVVHSRRQPWLGSDSAPLLRSVGTSRLVAAQPGGCASATAASAP